MVLHLSSINQMHMVYSVDGHGGFKPVSVFSGSAVDYNLERLTVTGLKEGDDGIFKLQLGIFGFMGILGGI